VKWGGGESYHGASAGDEPKFWDDGVAIVKEERGGGGKGGNKGCGAINLPLLILGEKGERQTKHALGVK